MEDNRREMPCPQCPADCPRLSDTCKPFCKIYKEWHREHKPPEPRVTVAEKYRNEMNKKAAMKAVKAGRRRR